MIQPLLKWTGCKRRLVPVIRAFRPERFGGYVEPFAGSGAVFFNVLVRGNVSPLRTRITCWDGAAQGNARSGAPATLADLSPDAMAVHEAVRDRPERLLQGLYDHLSALRAQGVDYYYAVRERFNRDRDPADLAFLTRTCYWGVTRFNRDGDFNIGFHAGRFPKLKGLWRHVRAQSHLLRRVDLAADDYERILERAGEDDWVYLDPPYPGGSQVYLGGPFDYDRFTRVLADLDRRGCRVLLSFAWDAQKDGEVLASSETMARTFATSLGRSTLAVVRVGDYGVWHAGRAGTKVRECLIANYGVDLDAAAPLRRTGAHVEVVR